MIKEDIKKVSILPIVFYVLSGFMILYSIFTLVNSHEYISALISQGKIDITTQFKKVVYYYFKSSIPYVLYSIILGVIGYIINKLESLRQEKKNKFINETHNNDI